MHVIVVRKEHNVRYVAHSVQRTRRPCAHRASPRAAHRPCARSAREETQLSSSADVCVEDTCDPMLSDDVRDEYDARGEAGSGLGVFEFRREPARQKVRTSIV
jgi:hypothetical protein